MLWQPVKPQDFCSPAGGATAGAPRIPSAVVASSRSVRFDDEDPVSSLVDEHANQATETAVKARREEARMGGAIPRIRGRRSSQARLKIRRRTVSARDRLDRHTAMRQEHEE